LKPTRTGPALAAVAASLALCCAAARPANAQTTTFFTRGSFGAINYEDRQAGSAVLHGFTQYGGQSQSVSGEATYSFGQGNGTSLGAASDTTRISGTAWGSSTGLGFFDLKAGVRATLEDAYLDLRGIEDAPESDGMKAPYYWIASAGAGWTRTARFNGFTVAGNSYTVKWIFGVDGVKNEIDAGLGFAYLGFQYGANPRYSFSTTSLDPQVWATPSMPVTWGEAVQTNAAFSTDWQYNMLFHGEEVRDDDGVLIGYRAPSLLQGTVDYASTTRLQEIQVFDQTGARFYDFWVDDGAGNVLYAGAPGAAAVPEPATLPLLASVGAPALPVLIGARRIRRRARLS
jgi:hypothetical protein